MTTTHFDPTNRDLSQAAKYINKAMHSKCEEGDYVWANQLSKCIDLLAAPDLREPVLPDVPKRVYTQFQRSQPHA